MLLTFQLFNERAAGDFFSKVVVGTLIYFLLIPAGIWYTLRERGPLLGFDGAAAAVGRTEMS